MYCSLKIFNDIVPNLWILTKPFLSYGSRHLSPHVKFYALYLMKVCAALSSWGTVGSGILQYQSPACVLSDLKWWTLVLCDKRHSPMCRNIRSMHFHYPPSQDQKKEVYKVFENFYFILLFVKPSNHWLTDWLTSHLNYSEALQLGVKRRNHNTQIVVGLWVPKFSNVPFSTQNNLKHEHNEPAVRRRWQKWKLEKKKKKTFKILALFKSPVVLAFFILLVHFPQCFLLFMQSF